MNQVFAALILSSVVVAAFTGRMGALTEAAIASARTAVELALSLLGQMTLWLGLVGVLEAAGALPRLSRWLTPVLRRLFPDVPVAHPAMGAMVMNLSANVLGLGNAATPLGLKAMRELDTLNPRPGVATNAMAVFLAINTAGVGALPLNAVALRAAAGSSDPAGIIIPTVLAGLTATAAAATVAILLQRSARFRVPPPEVPAALPGPLTAEPAAVHGPPTAEPPAVPGPPHADLAAVHGPPPADPPAVPGPPTAERAAALPGPPPAGPPAVPGPPTAELAAMPRPPTAEPGAVPRPPPADPPALPGPPPAGTATAPAPASAPSALTRWLALAVGLALVVAVLRFVLLDIEPARDTLRDLNSKWLVPLLIAAIILVGLAGGARVYQAFISAAKEGFTTVVSIIPFLVGMLVAIGLFRASGALEAVVSVVGPVTGLIGFPPEALPMALLRPFSGSGSLGVLGDVLKTHGPDSFLGYLVSVMNGSTETTFYVLALYGGAAGIKDLRHTVIACVTGDVVGPVAALVLCRLFFS